MECAAEHDGIRVNTVHPGVIDTPIWTKLGTFGPMLYSDSPPVKVTCSTAPCAALVTVPTVALVITLQRKKERTLEGLLRQLVGLARQQPVISSHWPNLAQAY